MGLSHSHGRPRRCREHLHGLPWKWKASRVACPGASTARCRVGVAPRLAHTSRDRRRVAATRAPAPARRRLGTWRTVQPATPGRPLARRPSWDAGNVCARQALLRGRESERGTAALLCDRCGRRAPPQLSLEHATAPSHLGHVTPTRPWRRRRCPAANPPIWPWRLSVWFACACAPQRGSCPASSSGTR